MTTAMDKSMDKRTSSSTSLHDGAETPTTVRSSEKQQDEATSRTQNKVLSFSIEAILNSPHPKRPSRNNVQNKHSQVTHRKPDQTRTALNTLEEFASTTLKVARDDQAKNHKESKPNY